MKSETISVDDSLQNALRISNELVLRKIRVEINYRRDYPMSLYPITELLNDNSGINTIFPPIKEVLHMAWYGLGMFVIRSNTTSEKLKNASKPLSLCK